MNNCKMENKTSNSNTHTPHQEGGDEDYPPKRSNSTIVESDKCAHAVIIKDMCGVCGKNLRPEGGFVGERIEPTQANVSMIHHVPELVVSRKIADELGARDHENILRQKKLILLLDLDQTLVHTSNRPPRPEEAGASDLISYRLGGCPFFTKIRPYARKLLERLNKLYEMHIVTFGQRMYAHKIAEILDPSRSLFDYRILSRDELLSSMHKTGNLKALFPCSEQLILMLDDRPDVWMHSEALIRIKPYRFFLEVGDINAPPQEFLDAPTKMEVPTEPPEESPEQQEIVISEKPNFRGNDNELDVSESSKEEEKQNDEVKVCGRETEKNSKNDDEKGSAKKEEKLAKKVKEKEKISLTDPITPLADEDTALEHIERVLTEVHSSFYQLYERDKKIPDVKRVVRWHRSRVLASECIVFSGLIPIGVDVRACEIYRLCTQFGATIGERIVEGKTTVLVATRAATDKYRQARRHRIPVVNTHWLDACFERWRRVDKRDFAFRQDDDDLNHLNLGAVDVTKRRFTEAERGEQSEDVEQAGQVKRHRVSSPSLCLDEKMDHFAQMDTLSMKTLHEMEDEVDSALSDDGDDEGDGPAPKVEGSGSPSSSADYSDTNDNGRRDGEEVEGVVEEDELPSTSGDGKKRRHNNQQLEERMMEREEEFEMELHQAGEDDEEDEEDPWAAAVSKGYNNDEDSTRDAEYAEDEDELYDEMADDLEEQLIGGGGGKDEDGIAERLAKRRGGRMTEIDEENEDDDG